MAMLGILGITVLAAGVVVLLLVIALGLVAIVLSDRAERRTVIVVVVIGGLLLLLCGCTAAGLAWYLTTREPPLAPLPVLLVPTPAPLSLVTLASGTCASDFIALSQAADGRIDFAATRMPPHSPLTGGCAVATFTVTGEMPGTHVVAFDSALLADRGGNPLSVTASDGSITTRPIATPSCRPTASGALSPRSPTTILTHWRSTTCGCSPTRRH